MLVKLFEANQVELRTFQLVKVNDPEYKVSCPARNLKLNLVRVVEEEYGSGIHFSSLRLGKSTVLEWMPVT